MQVQRITQRIEVLGIGKNNAVVVGQAFKERDLPGNTVGQEYVVGGKINDVFACCVAQSLIKSRTKPFVPGIGNKTDVGIVPAKFSDFLPGAIGTGIVDYDEFDILIRLFNHRAQGLLHESFVVVSGADDGNLNQWRVDLQRISVGYL